MTTYNAEAITNLNSQYENQSPQNVLEWGIKRFGKEIALFSSLGAEDMVLLDMLTKITATPNVFVLDTGRLHQETYDLLDKSRNKYDIEINLVFPKKQSVERMVRGKGPNSFYRSVENRKECCYIRKVEPLREVLTTLSAWITGLRREQSAGREAAAKIEVDAAHGNIIKINPLADWSTTQVWDYLKTHDVPYHALHDQGFPSIGCAPCTRAVKPGEAIRAGRWWWESPEFKECGLHVKP